MLQTRRTDPDPSRHYFRSERMLRQGTDFYFLTREGTTEGPFSSRERAQRGLDDYIRAVTSGFLATSATYGLEPLEA